MPSVTCFLRSGFMFLLLGCSIPALAQQEADPDRAVDAHLLKRVSAFLEHFIDPLKTAPQQAALFTDDAQYYERGRVGDVAIIRDIEYFARRWPQRDYRLTAIHYITPDPASNRVFVSYEISYHVANRSKAASGKAQYGAVLVDPVTSPKVEWIKETIAK